MKYPAFNTYLKPPALLDILGSGKTTIAARGRDTA